MCVGEGGNMLRVEIYENYFAGKFLNCDNNFGGEIPNQDSNIRIVIS